MTTAWTPTYAEVGARVAGRTISASTKPTAAQVEAWITEAVAEISATLLAAAIDPASATGADALVILKSWACDYPEAHIRMAYAAAGGDGGNDDGKDILERHYKRLDDIMVNPNRYGAILLAGTAPTSTTSVRGSVLTDSPLFSMDTEL